MKNIKLLFFLVVLVTMNAKSEEYMSPSSKFNLSENQVSSYLKKAKEGDFDAAFRLSQYYGFIVLDSKKQIKWLTLAAEGGHKQAMQSLYSILFCWLTKKIMIQ